LSVSGIGVLSTPISKLPAGISISVIPREFTVGRAESAAIVTATRAARAARQAATTSHRRLIALLLPLRRMIQQWGKAAVTGTKSSMAAGE
jgi:hypothetical protein